MRAAFVMLPALLLACSPSEAEPQLADAESPANDAGADVTASNAPGSLLEYPPGPYGTGAVGEVLADFRVQGYAMSPTQRDSTKLAFRDITLGEVRSRPGCACLMIIWTGAGQGCQPCVEADSAIGAGIANGESVCALEIVQQSFDSFEFNHNDNQPAPPTRSDLDVFTQTGRQPFPVGLLTDDAMAKLGAGAIPGIPSTYVVRTADMRIAGMIFGRADSLVSDAKTLCASPLEGVQTLARDIAPNALALDATHAYVADGGGRIARVARTGGLVETVTSANGEPLTVALSSTEVYWSTATAIGAAAKSGAAARVLLTSPADATYRSIATDGVRVYFTRSDGLVGNVKIETGEESTLATNEAAPTNIVVDETSVYWLDAASNEVASVLKGGGPRVSLLEASTVPIGSIVLGGDQVYVREVANTTHFAQVFAVPKTGGGARLVTQLGLSRAFDFDAETQLLDFVQAPYDRTPHDVSIGSFGTATVDFGEPLQNYPRMLTAGRRWVNTVASGNDGYIYWITDAPEGGSLERMKR